MTLKEDAQNILQNFDNTSSEEIIDVLNQIKSKLQVDITRQYLEGKIQEIKETNTETEKKKICKKMIQYLEWYLQGN